MSSLIGPVVCPRCRGDEFRLEDWETYTSVLCRQCGRKIGELTAMRGEGWERVADLFSNTSSTPLPSSPPEAGEPG